MWTPGVLATLCDTMVGRASNVEQSPCMGFAFNYSDGTAWFKGNGLTPTVDLLQEPTACAEPLLAVWLRNSGGWCTHVEHLLSTTVSTIIITMATGCEGVYHKHSHHSLTSKHAAHSYQNFCIWQHSGKLCILQPQTIMLQTYLALMSSES